MPRKIVIDPVTRVEGHGKVSIRMDDDHKVLETRLHIVEFRGFERFVQGRPFWEAIVLVQRLCGICPVSHHLCAAKAMDVPPSTVNDEWAMAVAWLQRVLGRRSP